MSVLATANFCDYFYVILFCFFAVVSAVDCLERLVSEMTC